jgi:hypothetical protein
MKTTIKLLSTAFLAAFVFLTACEGPQGEPGPAGANGTNGTNGTNGKDGNANVIQLNYGPVTHTGSPDLFYNLTNITEAQILNSLYLVYVNPSDSGTNWYQIPGGTVGNSKVYRTYLTMASGTNPIRIYLNRTAGTGNDFFTKTRILIIPANDIRNGRVALPDIDFSDYEAVKKYYNLKDEDIINQ